MTWVNFLHLYQPANADAYHIQEAIEKCYRPLFELLEKNPNWRLTLNISGCLLLRLEAMNELALLRSMKKVVARGQVELVGGPAYHPLLPLISEAEAEIQIKEQEHILRHFFGISRPKGFFLPEMAYEPKTAKLIKRLGYKWLILDPIVAKEKIDSAKTYIDAASLLTVIFRSRAQSNTYVPQTVLALLATKENIIITATDGELYGLRHENQKELKMLIKDKRLKTKTVSEYLLKNKPIGKIKLVAGSWESTKEEIKQGIAFALWFDKKNQIHKYLWELADLAQAVAKKYPTDPNYYWARWHLVRGLASCTFWWASGRDLSYNFGPTAWSPDEIERGINELIRSIRSMHSETSRGIKIKAEKLQIKIKRLIWDRHWRYYW